MKRLFCNTRTTNLKRLASLLTLFILPFSAFSQTADTLFQSDEIINLELRADFSALQADRKANPLYHDGELIYHSNDGKTVYFSVKVMVRGNFRLDPSHCNFPPLFINFEKDEVKNSLFDKQDKLKLVTPCQNEEYVAEEYLIYKMYNEVTDLSYKVRLAKILYFDTSTDKKLFERFSFFIEDKDHLAKRINAFELDSMMMQKDLNRVNVNRLAVFEYLIGNKEWFINTRHNIVIMHPDDPGKLPVAVPFDFDFAKIIDADYTKPSGVPDSILTKRRVFKGLCQTAEELNPTFDFFRALRPEFESLINQKGLISEYDKNRILNYVDSFYKIIDNSELVKQQFTDICESWNAP